MNTLPRIGLMLGDMTGIGPEINAKVLAAGTFKPLARIVVIGDARVLDLGIKDARVELKWKNYADIDAISFAPINKGVTVTAGLKTVFTTPAHGTAFDIVGQGKADTGALEQALRIATKMAATKMQ